MSRRGNYKKKTVSLDYLINIDNLDGTITDLVGNTFVNSGVTTAIEYSTYYAMNVIVNTDLKFGSSSKYAMSGNIPFSVGGWVYVSNNGKIYHYIAQSADKNGQKHWELRYDYANGGWGLRLYSTLGSYSNSILATANFLQLNTWNHIFATYDGSGTKEGINIYRNGVAQSVVRREFGTFTGIASFNGYCYFRMPTISSYVNKQSQMKLSDIEVSAIGVLNIYDNEKGYFGIS